MASGTGDDNPSSSTDVELVEELQNRLDGDAELAAAFAALTPGRQREYNFHVSGAKQAATRERRIDRCVPKILAGKGFRDRDASAGATTRSAKQAKQTAADGGPVLLSGGNPQIPKGDGPAPVAAYLAAMPGWKQDVGRQLDALIERAVPQVRRAVRWNSPFYGVEGSGWFVSLHCFDRYVKVTFLNGARLDPLPPVDSKDPDTRYAHIHEDEAIDEARFLDWLAQGAAIPGWDGF
jgi:hypothetical protein